MIKLYVAKLCIFCETTKENAKNLQVTNKISLNKVIPRRSHPAQHGEGFDAPPTLERSGSEHRRAVTSLIPMVGI